MSCGERKMTERYDIARTGGGARLTRIGRALGALIMLAGVATGCAGGAQAAAAVATPGLAEAQPVVSAEAYVHPLREVDLAFKRGGTLSEVLVKEGDRVQAGQPLLRLEDADLQTALAVAQATLAQAQATVAQTSAAPRDAQIASGQADVDRASAALAQAKVGPTQEQIGVAEAHLRTLEAQLAASLAGTRPETLAASQADLLQAEAAVRSAQAAYDKISFAPDVAASSQALALQDATLKLAAAKANYAALQNGPTQTDVDVLRAQVAEGQAALAQAEAGSTPEEIAQAQASLAGAQSQLALTKAGARREDIAVSEAGVLVAQAGVDQARAALADATLVAPFAGTIGALDLQVGQYIAPGATVLSLADMSGWRLLTDNLTEKDVVQVAEGQAVQVTVDALPGVIMGGKVTHIKPRSETKAGDVTYTVEVALPHPDPRLRWGMTASVQFGKY